MMLFDRLFGSPKPDKFARSLIAALKDAGDTREVRYEADEFRLIFIEDGDEIGIANLRNLFNEYCAAPKSERPQCLRNISRGFLSQFKEIPEDFQEAKHDIRPKIWPRSTIEDLRHHAMLNGKQSADIPSQAVGEHLVVTLVYDLPEAVHTIDQQNLDNWGISFYEAMEIARRNLEITETTFADIGGHLYGSATGDTYDASRLLNLDLIRKLNVNGDYVAMVPNRNTLLVTGLDDETGLRMMYEIAEKTLSEEPRPMVAMPLRLDGDEWMDWNVPPTHQLHTEFAKLEMMWLLQKYTGQKAMLDAIHERDGVDLFVSGYMAVKKRKTGTLVSYCVWANGVESLLPVTQKVVFARGEDDFAAIAKWEKVQELAGDLMEPTDDYPPRYRVKQFPDDDVLSALGNEEL